MKHIQYIMLAGILHFFTTVAHGQGVLGKVQKAVKGIENVNRNIKKNEERRAEVENKVNPKSTQKSEFHQARIGQIHFAQGQPNPQLEDETQFVKTVDLSSPSYFNVYLEDPLHTIVARNNNLEEYSVVNSAFIRRYYINDELIVSYGDQIEEDPFRQQHIFSDVLVPASHADFEEHEMRVGLLAHVFSSLQPGTYKLKVEYALVKSTELPNTDGSAAKYYDNQEFTIASGEVDVKIDAASLLKYCTRYGRPKFDKGVLEGQANLEKQIETLIKRDSKRTPVYIYANDNWTLNRGALDRVISREVRVYYVFTNDKGRCEVADCVILQGYDGSTYQAPKFTLSKYAPAYKYVCCQNY